MYLVDSKMGKPVAFLDFQGTLGGSGIDDIKSFAFFLKIQLALELNTNIFSQQRTIHMV
jgi:hypothetical protein